MASESFLEYKKLVSEITKGKEQVKQLRASSSGNQERSLARMLASYEEALSILNGNSSEGQGQAVISSPSDPPDPSVTRFEDSSRGSKKRRSLSRFTKQVRVRSDVSFGGLKDGYAWRKYGQKDILNSNYPRAYYRCEHRHTQGCMATKQVHRQDDDPNVFEITYRGEHTCMRSAPVAAPLASPEKEM